MPPHLKKDFFKLVDKYLNGTASAEEINIVENYYAHFSNDPDITEGLSEDDITALKASLRQKVDERISHTQKGATRKIRREHLQWAAAVLLFLTVSLIVSNKLRQKLPAVQAHNLDLAPGGNKATLTLADGSKVSLDSAKSGTLATQPGTHVIKQNQQLSYQAITGNSGLIKVSYNTLTTPKGGQYQLVLADGTKVWLNAASSLKFPTVFATDERVVELTGEAYFEVAHNAKQPFKVKTSSQTIQDIGTQFDINAYADEDGAATTLVEGSVKIYDGQKQTIIKPGQQYLAKLNGLSEIKSDVDIDEVTAWKSGMFQFNNADIKTIMRQISRWYNVEVVYQGAVPASTYHGRISRNSNASSVLKILELSGINFTIEEGRKIIVR